MPALTSVNVVVPGAVKDSMRAVWEIGQVDIFDGGADADGDTQSDNALLETPGIFVP